VLAQAGSQGTQRFVRHSGVPVILSLSASKAEPTVTHKLPRSNRIPKGGDKLMMTPRQLAQQRVREAWERKNFAETQVRFADEADREDMRNLAEIAHDEWMNARGVLFHVKFNRRSI